MPFLSLLRRQEPSLKRSFSCRAGSRHQNENNQIFDFIGIYYFQKYVRQAKRCFVLGTRLRGCDRYLVLQKSQAVWKNSISDGLYDDAAISAKKLNPKPFWNGFRRPQIKKQAETFAKCPSRRSCAGRSPAWSAASVVGQVGAIKMGIFKYLILL